MAARSEENNMVEPVHEEPPKGALLLMLVFLVLIVLAWTSIYLELWTRG
jgi:hypothetical protein